MLSHHGAFLVLYPIEYPLAYQSGCYQNGYLQGLNDAPPLLHLPPHKGHVHADKLHQKLPCFQGRLQGHNALEIHYTKSQVDSFLVHHLARHVIGTYHHAHRH